MHPIVPLLEALCVKVVRDHCGPNDVGILHVTVLHILFYPRQFPQIHSTLVEDAARQGLSLSQCLYW